MEEMLERISSTELVQWHALYELEAEEEEFRRQHEATVNPFR